VVVVERAYATVFRTYDRRVTEKKKRSESEKLFVFLWLRLRATSRVSGSSVNPGWRPDRNYPLVLDRHQWPGDKIYHQNRGRAMLADGMPCAAVRNQILRLVGSTRMKIRGSNTFLSALIGHDPR